LLNDGEYEPLPVTTTIPFSCCAVFIGGELMRLFDFIAPCAAPRPRMTGKHLTLWKPGIHALDRFMEECWVDAVLAAAFAINAGLRARHRLL